MKAMLRTALLAILAAVAGRALPLSAEEPPSVTVVTLEKQVLTGRLVSSDDEKIVLEVAGEQKTLAVAELEPVSVYMVRKHLIDDNDASAHMALGKFLLAHGETSLAQREFARAKRLDPAREADIQRLLAEAAEEARRNPKPEATTQKSAGAEDDKPADDPNIKDGVVKFPKPTEEQITTARDRAKAMAAAAVEKGIAKLVPVETDHFIIYTDWPRDRHRGLADVCEKMWTTLCTTFNVPTTTEIFPGPLPVYVFWTKEGFTKFASEVDNGNPQAAGYASYRSDGLAHIVMNQNRSYDTFCEVMVHEGTHAFISRFVSGHGIPTWLNEGLAEMTSADVVPRSDSRWRAGRSVREAMRTGRDVECVLATVSLDLFDYGIAQSFTRFLLAVDNKKLIDFLIRCKQGKSMEEAMKDVYGWTREEFLENWRKWAANTYR